MTRPESHIAMVQPQQLHLAKLVIRWQASNADPLLYCVQQRQKLCLPD